MATHFGYAVTSPPPRKRRWPRILGGLVGLIILAAIVVFTWGSRKYHQVVELSHKASQQYQALESDFPFEPPPQSAPPVAPTNLRLQAALQVRQASFARLTPGLRGLIADFLELKALDEAQRLYPAALGQVDTIQRLMAANQEDLRAAKMSPTEFSWWIGLVVYEALTAERNAASAHPLYRLGGQYRTLLQKAESITLQNGEHFSGDAYYNSLASRYAAQGAVGSGLADFQVPTLEEAALDLVIADAVNQLPNLQLPATQNAPQ